MNTCQYLSDWKFKACDEETWYPAQVPGCVHMDLLLNRLIPDPFYGMNERKLQWIDKKDWEYETIFDAAQEVLGCSQLELVFEGLDTYADVWFNDRHVLTADNMFRKWKVDVKPFIRTSGNRLKVKFRSPVKEDLPKLERLGYALPATNDQSDVGELGDKKISVFARKAPYHYGWDWGPRFVTSGIWKVAGLEGWSDATIEDVYIQQKEVTTGLAKLSAIVEIQSECNGTGKLKLVTEGFAWEQHIELVQGTQTVELELDIPKPKLWWCRGLGEAHLYHFQAELSVGGKRVAEKAIRTGLRSMRLVRDPDEWGTSFYIELNGVPVFSKGANHIPNDSFVTEVTYERYLHEIQSAAEANMNMLRVWGGGIYEADAFYELCDEFGILVWQDFMFACSMYPGDQAYLDNVRKEAEHNVKRLRNHPCIALWCGNNEIDSAWAHYDEKAGWGWKKLYEPTVRETIWNDYVAVFHRILPEAVGSYMPGAQYWPSSPLLSESFDRNQHAYTTSTAGDIHYWGVWHAVEPFENYNVHVGRFMSEYGFQSFPELKSVRTYAEAEDMALESEVMLAHQKNNRGNRLIKQYMDIYMQEPKDFPSFLYMSQVLQAEAMKTAIEAHRRRKPFCMGSLYWQMNDTWPVASWAGIDYYGRWKALHYYAKRSFKDVLVSFDGSHAEQVDLYVVSDINLALQGTLHVKLLDFEGQELKRIKLPVELAANTGRRVGGWSAQELLEGRDPAAVVLHAEMEQNGQVLDSKEHYFVPSKLIRLSAPHIQVAVSEDAEGYRFTLETNVLAKQVWLSAEAEGVFSDNYFDLIPGRPVTVRFFPRGTSLGTKASASTGKLEVRSMSDFIK